MVGSSSFFHFRNPISSVFQASCRACPRKLDLICFKLFRFRAICCWNDKLIKILNSFPEVYKRIKCTKNCTNSLKVLILWENILKGAGKFKIFLNLCPTIFLEYLPCMKSNIWFWLVVLLVLFYPLAIHVGQSGVSYSLEVRQLSLYLKQTTSSQCLRKEQSCSYLLQLKLEANLLWPPASHV